jgi:hypothetical protein
VEYSIVPNFKIVLLDLFNGSGLGDVQRYRGSARGVQLTRLRRALER